MAQETSKSIEQRIKEQLQDGDEINPEEVSEFPIRKWHDHTPRYMSGRTHAWLGFVTWIKSMMARYIISILVESALCIEPKINKQ